MPTAGELHFGHAALLNYNDLRLNWFDHHLKGLSTPVEAWPAVQYFVMGGGTGAARIDGFIDYGGRWQSSAHFPPSQVTHTAYHLHHDGRLDPQPPAPAISPSRYDFDPRDPVPTVGGCVSAANEFMPPGGFDQYARSEWGDARDDMPLSARGDVLCFQTDPLTHAMTIAGPIHVVLYVSSSAADTDFTAKLIDVFPADAARPLGAAINLTDGIMRAGYRDGAARRHPLEPGRVYELCFELYPTATVFQPGHRIRLDISSSNFPRFDVNPNTDTSGDNRIEIAHQAIHHDATHPSRVVLPVLASDGKENAPHD